MKLIELMEFIQDENRSEEFLRSRGILKTFSECINCGSDKLGMVRGDRWKCYSCKSEWTRRKDSLLSLVRMKYSEFILCMKFFELELTAEETAKQLKINVLSILNYSKDRKMKTFKILGYVIIIKKDQRVKSGSVNDRKEKFIVPVRASDKNVAETLNEFSPEFLKSLESIVEQKRGKKINLVNVSNS